MTDVESPPKSAEIVALQDELSKAKQQIEQVEEDIKRVEEDIKRVEADIAEAAKGVQDASTAQNTFLTYWMEKEKQLREKEKQLRQDKDRLREKEMWLMQELKSKQEEAASSKRPRIMKDVTRTTVDFTLDNIDRLPQVNSWFNVSGLYIAGLSRVGKPTKRLFCRKDTVRLLERLNQMKNGLRIFGPPGVGKSITVWFWMCYQAKYFGKKCLWIHIAKAEHPNCVSVSEEGCHQVSFLNLSVIFEYLVTSDADIIVIDGVTSLERHMEMCIGAFDFQHNSKRQAISVASMAFKTNVEDQDFREIGEFYSTPWEYTEYLSSFDDAEFCREVYRFMDTNECEKENEMTDEEVKNIVKSCAPDKFYYAGCSARWMFSYPITKITKVVGDCLNRVSNIVDLLKGTVGPASMVSANHLMANFEGHKQFFTSHYIAREALSQGGSEAVRLAYGIAQGLGNPSFTGWVVEMDFIHQVIASKGQRMQFDEEEWNVTDFCQCNMDEESLSNLAARILQGCWLQPKKWNQGGYDLACLCEVNGSRMLRCVQVTNAKNHGLNLKYFADLAQALVSALECVVDQIEIVMMIPDDIDASEFSISQSQVKHPGALASWKVGHKEEKWSKMKEHALVKIMKFKKSPF